MSAKVISAHLVQHDSEPTHYIHPYLFTHESESTGEVYVWSSDDNSLYSTLDEAMADPKEHHLIGNNYLLSLTNIPGDSDLSEILIHNLPDGDIIDRMSLGPVDSSRPGGNSKFLGVFEGNIAVWRNEGAIGGTGVIEIYTLSTEGKFTISDSLLSPPGCLSLESDSLPGTYFPPQAIHISSHEFIGVNFTKNKFPSSIDVTRYASSLNSTRQKQVTFNFSSSTLPTPNAKMASSLIGYFYLPKHNSLIMAHYEFDFEDSANPDSTTAIRCLDFDTLELKWITILHPGVTSKLRYIPSMDAILSVGDGPTSIRTGEGILKKVISHTTLTVLDPSTGKIIVRHVLGEPERPCGNVHWDDIAGVCCDLTPTEDEVAIIFGDGQSTVIPIEQLLESGFPKIEDGSGKENLKTNEFPAIEPSLPSDEEDQKRLREGNWRWVKRAFFGDKVAFINPTRGRGFAVLSWN